MTLSLRNLDWLRSVKIDGNPSFGQRLYEMMTDIRGGVNTLEQQGNFDLSGTPGAPPQPQELTVVPHPQGWSSPYGTKGSSTRASNMKSITRPTGRRTVMR